MSEASIPAWKRLGLKQAKGTPKQSEKAYDPLKEGLKRAHEAGETVKPAKPAKRPKVSKADRPAPSHELDQLAYLRQFSEDRANWKFSKQKQNWILKHMFTEISDERYDQPLLDYIEGLMGSSRNWVAESARDVVKRWNEFMREDLEKKKQENKEPEDKTESKTEGKPEENHESEAKSGPTEQKGSAKQKPMKSPAPQKAEAKVPAEKMVRRAKRIVEILTGESLQLEFLDSSP